MNGHDRTRSQQVPSRQAQESKRVRRSLHPTVYVALVGLVLWLVLAIWGFGYDGQTDYLLAIVAKAPGRQDEPQYESNKRDVDLRMQSAPDSPTLVLNWSSILIVHSSLHGDRGTIWWMFTMNHNELFGHVGGSIQP